MLLVDWLLEPLPSRWFVECSERSLDTGWTYARAIELWWRWLIDAGIGWRDAQACDWEEWVATQSPGSARHRGIVVAEFYRWAHAARHLDTLPFRIRTKSRADLVGVWVDPPRVRRRQLKTIAKEEFDRVLAANTRQDDGLRLRDELMAEFPRFTGLRRKQVAGLTVDQFEVLDPRAVVHAIDLDPTWTKGQKPQAVLVPRLLAHRLRRYIDVYRARTVAEAARRRPTYKTPRALFLTRHGGAVSREYVGHVWRRSASLAGVDGRLHANRHTFATMMATEALTRGVDALLMLKAQLGHASIATTVKYIHLAETRSQIMLAAQIVNDIYTRAFDAAPGGA
jgi:site-specific recombinase XerD